MRGHELTSRLLHLMRKHRIAPIERPPLPLLPATTVSQIVEGVAASADVDAERMSFARGSLSWSDDLSKIPLRFWSVMTPAKLQAGSLSSTTTAMESWAFVPRSTILTRGAWAASVSPRPWSRAKSAMKTPALSIS